MLLKFTLAFLALLALAFDAQAGLVDSFWYLSLSKSFVGFIDLVARKSERSLTNSNGDATLEKRAPANSQPLMSRQERETARTLAMGLRSQLTHWDLVLFIGNSARWVFNAFRRL